MALELVARIDGSATAQAIQLGIEYDPQPPFDAGSAAKAPAELVEAMTAIRNYILYGAPAQTDGRSGVDGQPLWVEDGS